MPSDPASDQASNPTDGALSGRCYCGRSRFTAHKLPQTVAYCHCSDCRRWTGAAVGVFAAFAVADIASTPPLGEPVSHAPGVERWFCRDCGSPLAARFDYQPDQLYVPIGLIDQAADLPPEIHCHADAQLPWLHISDTLHRASGSGRDTLAATFNSSQRP